MRGLFLINIIKFVCTVVGTFIGAGFASGREIYSFFFKYGKLGIIGICISSLFIGYFLYIVIKISRKNNVENYEEFLEILINKKYIKNIFLYLIDIFFVLSFCVMTAGFSAFLEQEFNIKKIINYIFILFFSYIILRKKTQGIVKINKIIIPIIIFFILFIFIKKIGIFNIFNFYFDKKNNLNYNYIFLIKSFLYANYNLLTVIPIVVSLSGLCKNKKHIKISSIICTIIIFILSIIIFSILAQSTVNLEVIEMPTIFIIGRYGKIYKNIFAFIIGSAIITTLISCGYSFLQKYEKNDKEYNKKIYILVISAVISSNFSFSNLVNVLYPVFGALACIQNYFILKSIIKNKI